MMTKRRKASTVVYVEGRVLAISNGIDTSDWGFPGGGVEDGETYREGARRELQEETGARLASGARLTEVLTVLNDSQVWVIYAVEGDVELPAELRSRPFEGYVRFMEPHQLVTRYCRNRKVNGEVMASLGILR